MKRATATRLAGGAAGPSAGVFSLAKRLKPNRTGRRKGRRGAAVVEFALVAPIFFLLVLGMIEYGRMVMVQQILTNASREGARKAVLEGMSDDAVRQTVNDYLSGAGISGATVTITEAPPVAPDYAESKTVTVEIPFNQVSWLPSPMYLRSYQMSAVTTMRNEVAQ